MATATSTTQCSSSSNAHFRASLHAVDDAFTTLGWTRTADTGQIDLTTVVVPSFGVWAGYSMFRMADALQSTAPCFVKVEYSIGGPSNSVQIRLTVGQGTDGAGSVTGVQLATFALSSATDHTTVDAVTYLSGDTNRFLMLAYDDGSTTNGMLVSIERSKDATGADTAEAIFVAWGVTNGALSSQVLVCGQGAAQRQGSATSALPTSGSNFTFGTDVGLSGVNYFAGKRYNDGTNLLSFLQADFIAGITISADMYGSTHSYRILHARGPQINQSSAQLIAMLYE